MIAVTSLLKRLSCINMVYYYYYYKRYGVDFFAIQGISSHLPRTEFNCEIGLLSIKGSLSHISLGDNDNTKNRKFEWLMIL